MVGDAGYLYPELAGKVVRKGPEVADARRLGELLLSRWEVENRSFWVRDVLFRGHAKRAL